MIVQPSYRRKFDSFQRQNEKIGPNWKYVSEYCSHHIYSTQLPALKANILQDTLKSTDVDAYWIPSTGFRFSLTDCYTSVTLNSSSQPTTMTYPQRLSATTLQPYAVDVAEKSCMYSTLLHVSSGIIWELFLCPEV